MPLAESNYKIPRNDSFASGLPLFWVRDPREPLPVAPEQSSVTITVKVDRESPTSAGKQEGIIMDAPPYVESPFTKLFGRIESLGDLEDNWNSYGAKAPNKTALFWAHRVLQQLLRSNFAPRAVKPSPDSGVGIIFISETKQTTIECLNDGNIFVIASDSVGQPRVRPILQTPEHIKRAIEEIQDSFSL
jgi:hypothetical protein